MRDVRLSRLAVGVVTLVLLGVLAAGAAAGDQRVVKSAKNKTLNETILVDLKGMTLYRLSGEKQGALVCVTPACFAVWRPLWIAPGTTPTGAKNLGTLKRPGGEGFVRFALVENEQRIGQATRGIRRALTELGSAVR